MTLKKTLARTSATALVGLALATAPAGLAMAQETAPETTESQAPTFDDATLEKFVDAAMEVTAVRDAYAVQLQDAASETDAEAIVTEARTAMQEAIDSVEGMDVEKYVEIGEAAQTDEVLAARITAMAEERESLGDG